jgi:hypothetical protein
MSTTSHVVSIRPLAELAGYSTTEDRASIRWSSRGGRPRPSRIETARQVSTSSHVVSIRPLAGLAGYSTTEDRVSNRRPSRIETPQEIA